MKLASIKSQINRLNEKNIVIEEKYYRNYHNKKDIISYRSSDGSKNDKVYDSIKLEKKYFLNGKLIHKEKDFDKNIRYTFIFNGDTDIINCSNCGYKGKATEFINGCPYCDSNYNIDFSLKNNGKATIKEILNNKKSKLSIFIFSLLWPIIVFFTSDYDLLPKLLFSLFIYPFFLIITYFLLILLIINPLVIYRSIKNYNITSAFNSLRYRKFYVDERKFYNSLNNELIKYYFNNEKYEDIIDFDIVKYLKIKYKKIENGCPVIFVSLKLRKVYLINKKIFKDTSTIKLLIKYNFEHIDSNNSNNLIICKNCGASIDITKNECEYCHNKLDLNYEWEIIKILKD